MVLLLVNQEFFNKCLPNDGRSCEAANEVLSFPNIQSTSSSSWSWWPWIKGNKYFTVLHFTLTFQKAKYEEKKWNQPNNNFERWFHKFRMNWLKLSVMKFHPFTLNKTCVRICFIGQPSSGELTLSNALFNLNNCFSCLKWGNEYVIKGFY